MPKRRILGMVGMMIFCVMIFSSCRVQSSADDAQDMVERIEAAIGEDYKKQSVTELVATLKYADEDGNEINYHILRTTYYEADPVEVTGLNTSAIHLIFDTETADSCHEMKIQDWDAALYEKGALAYLCWTYSPEVSYILEYNPEAVRGEEIIKMAESVRPLNGE